MKLSFKLLLLFAIFINSPAFGEVTDIGIITRIEGFLANHWACDKTTAEELQFLNSCLPQIKNGESFENITKLGSKVMENYSEELLFQETAKLSHASTNCHGSLLAKHVSDPKYARSVHSNAFTIFNDIKFMIKDMHEQLLAKESLRASLNASNDHLDRTAVEANKKIQALKLGEEIKALELGISSMINQIPLGNYPDVKERILEMALTQTEIDEEKFQSIYAPSSLSLIPKLKKARDFYSERLNKDGSYNLGRDEKIAFVQSGQATQLIQKLDPTRKLDKKLLCRLNANYKQGPKTSSVIGSMLLTGASLGISGAAAGFALNTLRGASAIGMRTVAYSIGFYQIKHQCFGDTLNISTSNSCDPSMHSTSALSEASKLSCGVAVAFGTLPILAPYAGRLIGLSKKWKASAISRTPAMSH